MKNITLLFFATLVATLMWIPGHAQFTESFDTEIPSDWTVIDNDGQGETWEFSTTNPYLGAGSAHLLYEINAHDDYLITPQFTVTSGVSDQVSFYATANSTYYEETFDVKLSTTGTAPSDFTEVLGSEITSTNDYVQFVYSIPLSYAGQDVYVAVVGTSTNQFHFYLDEFSVGAGPTCPAPSDLAVSGITTDSADITWTESGNATQWDVVYGTPGFDPDMTGTLVNVNVDPETTLSGLDDSTAYDVYVRSVCDINIDESTFTGPMSFTTLCDPIDTLPYTEDFDTYGTGSDAFPSCWLRPVTYTASTVWPSIVSLNATSSPNSLQFQSLTDTPTYAVSPSFEEDIHNLRVSFMLKREGTSSGTMDIGVMADPLDINTFELVQTINPADNNHTEYIFDLNNTFLEGGNRHIALRHNSVLSSWFYWVDDFKVEPIPSCPAPTNFSIDGVTETTADISWTLGDSETSWNISWGTPGYTPGDVDQIDIDTASIEEYQITNLTTETAYDVYVQAHCDVGDESTWIGPLSIYTGYCQPTTTGDSGNIASFTADGDLGQNISNLSSGPGLDGNGYSDFSAQIVEVTAGEALDYTVTISSGTTGLKIWVDWNNDLKFDEVDDLVYQSSGYSGSFSGTIPILEGRSGTYRMRIGSSYIPGTGPLNACAHNNQGEYEDYTINVIPTGPPAINLNSAADFGILAATGISSAGASVISNTNIGVSPGVRASITGFPPSVVINGSIYASDDSAEVADMLAQAHLDLEAAYLFAKGASAPAPTPVAGEQGGLTLYPGIYKSTSTLLIESGDLTLDAQGDPNARWIFQIATALTTIGGAGGGDVILTGGAQAKNITWQVGSSVTIGNDTSFKGNILAHTSITFNTGSTSDGRLYAMNGLVALSGDIIIDQPCPAPTDLAVSNITGDSADISWTEGSIEDEWEVIYGPTNFDPNGTEGTTVSVDINPETALMNLDGSTDYDVYVRAICDVVNEIEWSGPVSFTTPCGSMAMPWNEDFESGTANNNIVPDLACWSQEIVSGTTNWKFVTANGDSSVLPHSGSLMAEFRNTSRGTAAKLVTPPMDLTSLNTAQLTFYYANANWTGDIDGLRVYYKKSASDPDWTLINGAEYTTEHATWEEVEIILPEAIGATNYVIAFEATSDYARGLNLDDVSIDEAQLSGFVYANGAWSPNHPSGVSTDADDITVVDGTASGVDSFNGTTDMNNLTIVQGATLEVNSILNLHGDLTINGDLVFVSTENGNGELGFVSATSNITGEATVQSYMSTNRSYRMVSSAVTTSNSVHDNWQEGASSNIDNPNPGFGTHITGNTVDQQDGFDATATGNPSMFIVDYSVTPNAFTAVPNTDVNTLDAGVPYLLFVRGDRSMDLTENGSAGETVLRATGTLEYGAQDPQTFPTVNAGEFAMFGNPYQSAVDVVSLFTNGGSNVNNAHYYVYDPTLADHGGYVTVILPGGGNTDGSDANQYLQPGQGAQFTASGNAPSLEFTEANKAPGNFTITSATGNQLSSDNMLTVQLFTTENFSNGGPTHDSFGIIFGEGLDNGITNADARKPMNFYENFGRDHNGTYLSLERREMPVPAEVYPLYSAGYAHPDYTLKMSVDGLEDTFLYLDDHYTGTSTLLEDGETVYSFGIDANDELSLATDRFSVRVEQRLGVDNNGLLAGVRLFPNPLNDNTFYINAPKLNGEQISVSISDLSGRQIFENMLDCRANTVTVSVNDNLASGVYLVTLRHGGEENTYRLVKK